MKIKLTIFLTTAFFFILSQVNCQWQKFVVDNDIDVAVVADIGDMDGDGRPDIMATDYNNNQIKWYKNNFPSWIEYSIANVNSTFAWIADVNGNGVPDVVACLYQSRKMVWYENQHPDWIPHIIDNSTDNADYTVVGDINGDSAIDVITAGALGGGGDLVWYENLHPGWKKHIIDAGANGIAVIEITDIDGDGLLDLACTLFEKDQIVWYKNENYGQSWTQYIVDSIPDLPWGVGSGDINSDGLPDLVATTGSGYFPLEGDRTFLLYTNTGESWEKTIIEPDMYSGVPDIMDVNGDGNMDIFTTAGPGEIRWYEKNQSTWTKHEIDPNIPSPRLYAFKDIDGDHVDDLAMAGGDYVAWYKNPYTTAAYAKSVEVSPACTQNQCDTFSIITTLNNPENHPVDVFAAIYDSNTVLIDSIQLLDDGLNGDGNAADNIWGGEIRLQSQTEGIYTVNLITHDNHFVDIQDVIYPSPVRFTTIGPVSLENYSFASSDTVFDPGDRININLTLKNNGSTVTASNIEAKLTSLDTLVSVSSWSRTFGDIAAGESSTSEYYGITIDDEWSGISQAPILVEISSDDYVYWKDTLYITVQGPSSIEDIREPIARLYPNPTNNILNIEINNSGNQGLEIDIYNITGRLIFQKKYRNTSTHFAEQIELSGYSKGIYLVKVRQDHAVYVGKVIVR